MPKGVLENTRLETRFTRLRDQIRELEVGMANLDESDAVRLLQIRSEVESYVVAQEALGHDMRAERTRLRTVDNIIERKSAELVRRVGQQGGLPPARKSFEPSADHWWWFIDQTVAERQRSSAIRISAVIIGAVLIVLLVNYVANTFFGMDPLEKKAFGHTSLAEQALYRGEYVEAIDEYRQALEVQPELAEAWAALAVVYQEVERPDEAQEALEQATKLISDRVDLALLMSRNYETVGRLDQALDYAEEAVALDPTSAEAYLVRGGIHDSLEERAVALDDFEKASELAQAQGEDALYVLARMRMGMLMQQGDNVPLPGSGGF